MGEYVCNEGTRVNTGGMFTYRITYTKTSKLTAWKEDDKHTGREMNKYETRQG